MAKIIDLPSYSDERGCLTVIEKLIPFHIKRVYFISQTPKNISRGGHRHKLTQQALICLKGQCKVYCNNGYTEETYILSNQDKCLLLDKDDWHTMGDFEEDSILLVLASEYYDINDYIDEPYR